VIPNGPLLGVGIGYSVIVPWAEANTAPASSTPAAQMARKWIFRIEFASLA